MGRTKTETVQLDGETAWDAIVAHWDFSHDEEMLFKRYLQDLNVDLLLADLERLEALYLTWRAKR
jgi:hypothetical protein